MTADTTTTDRPNNGSRTPDDAPYRIQLEFPREDCTYPDKVAMIFPSRGEEVTFAELEHRSRRLANHLREMGFERGDLVAVSAKNHPTLLTAYWAIQRIGLYITAVNPRLGEDEFRFILEDSGAKGVILGPGTAQHVPAVRELDKVELRISFDDTIDLPDGFEDLEAVLESASDEPLADQPRGADMLYSSGTTGRPKGVRPPLPDRKAYQLGDSNTALFVPYMRMGPDTVYLSPAPLYHAAPLRFVAIMNSLGATAVCMEKFDAEETLALIERYKVTHGQFVPTMFIRMLKLPEDVRNKYDLSSLQSIIHAAAPCPVDVKQQMIEWWGPIVHEYYAATELNGVTLINAQEWLTKPGSVGKALLGIIHICDDAGRELPAGEVGDIYFERDVTPFEYYNDPEKTKSTLHPEHPNWSTLGDMGYVDEDGFLFLTDRKNFMIISGGVNIYPQEIESMLSLHPAVSDIAVFGIPDKEMGQQVVAAVMVEPGHEPTEELARDLRSYVRERLAGYKTPRRFVFVDELPRLPTGKLAKKAMVQQYAYLADQPVPSN